uniref:Uncharacterized protein n=1 Tax=Fagus sylvatica TaxID=28930 RepID=A0A2N9FHJ1_FAGSY
MGNANGREEGIEDDRFPVVGGRSNGESGSESMGIAIGNNTPPHSPARSPSPILFAPQARLTAVGLKSPEGGRSKPGEDGGRWHATNRPGWRQQLTTRP